MKNKKISKNTKIDWRIKIKESSPKQDIYILNFIINEAKTPNYTGVFTPDKLINKNIFQLLEDVQACFPSDEMIIVHELYKKYDSTDNHKNMIQLLKIIKNIYKRFSSMKNKNIKPRPPLKEFSIEMEKVLKENDYKGDWKNEGIGYLINRLKEEVEELGLEISCVNKLDDKICKSIQHEAIDVANFAMMIWDNIQKFKKS